MDVKMRMSAKGHPIISPVQHAHDVFDAMKEGVEDIYVGAGADDLREAFTSDPKGFEQRRIERFYTDPIG